MVRETAQSPEQSTYAEERSLRQESQLPISSLFVLALLWYEQRWKTKSLAPKLPDPPAAHIKSISLVRSLVTSQRCCVAAAWLSRTPAVAAALPAAKNHGIWHCLGKLSGGASLLHQQAVRQPQDGVGLTTNNDLVDGLHNRKQKKMLEGGLARGITQAKVVGRGSGSWATYDEYQLDEEANEAHDDES
jgi:hypothetical protein